MENKDAHGGNIYGRKIYLDYSANLNPLRMPESVKKAIIEGIETYYRYPDNSCGDLTNILAEEKKLLPEWILCGNGAADLIYRYALAARPSRVLVLSPTFSEYEHAFRLAGADICYYLLKEEKKFEAEEDILEKLMQVDTIVLCNPNNPVGNLISPKLLERIVQEAEKREKRLFLDECFMELAGKEEYSMLPKVGKVQCLFILKAFTKTYAMAGVRLGYGISSDVKLLSDMQRMGAPWSVSGIAQIAGIAALKEKEYVQRAVKLIETERGFLEEGLQKLGFLVYPSDANFLLFRAYTELFEQMAIQGILIRQCGNYKGLNREYYRICVGQHKENERLLETLARCKMETGKGTAWLR